MNIKGQIDSCNITEVFERNTLLRQERLKYYNLISVTQDQIANLKSHLKPLHKKQPTTETQEFFSLLKSHHEDSINFYLDCLQKEVELINFNESAENPLNYVLELENLLKSKIKTCELSINIIRAVNLTYN